MAWYVSKTASNGYAVGDDTNSGISKSSPFLSLTAAKDAAFSSGGEEEIVINDGVYAGTELDPVNEYIILGANPPTSLLIRAENAGKVELIPGVVTACFRHTSSSGYAGTSVELRDLIIGRDVVSKGGVDTNYGYWPHAGVSDTHSVTLTRVVFKNLAITAINNPIREIVQITDCEFIADRTNSRGFIDSAGWVLGSLTIDGIVVDHQMWDTAGVGFIDVDMAAADISVSIKNVTGLVATDPADTGGGNLYGIRVTNSIDALIEGSNFTVKDSSSGASWTAYGIVAYGNDGALTAANQRIVDNTVNMQTSGGFAIAIGGDLGDVVANEADGSQIINNTVIGSGAFIAGNGHGIGAGENDSCKVEGNVVSQCDIGLLDKNGDLNVFAGNLVVDFGNGLTNAGVYAKGATNGDYFNNTIVINNNFSGIAFLAASDTGNVTGAEFKYNFVAVLSDTTEKVIHVQASQVATFDYNHFYVTGSLPVNPFSYQATDYANAGAWIAARETNGVNVVDNPFTNFTTYALSDTATGVTTGAKWWGAGARPVDSTKHSYPDFNLSIGGVQNRNVFGQLTPL